MKTPDNRVGQVQVIPFRQVSSEVPDWQVLMLKRNEQKGGFWQPVTGGINPGEPVIKAAYRELWEETGATTTDCVRMVDDGYGFSFLDSVYGLVQERVVAAVMRTGFDKVVRSDEHVDHRWVARSGAVALLGYESGRDALNHYYDVVTQQVGQQNV